MHDMSHIKSHMMIAIQLMLTLSSCRLRACRLVSTEDKDYFKKMLSTLMSSHRLNDAGNHEELFESRCVLLCCVYMGVCFELCPTHLCA